MIDLCPLCGGEGVVDGLVRGDESVPEVCRRCRGRGTVDVYTPDDLVVAVETFDDAGAL